MTGFECEGCGDRFDSKKGVTGHQNHPQTDCSKDDGYFQVGQSSEVSEDEDTEEAQEDHDPVDGSGGDEPDLQFEGTRDEGDHVFDENEGEEAGTFEDDEVVEGEVKETPEGAEVERPEVEEAETLELDKRVTKLPHKVLNLVLQKLFGAEELSDDELDELGEETRKVANEKLPHGKKKILDRLSLMELVWPHIESMADRSEEQKKPEPEASSEDENEEEENPELGSSQEEDTELDEGDFNW